MKEKSAAIFFDIEKAYNKVKERKNLYKKTWEYNEE